MKYLIIGKGGQLSKEFQKRLQELGEEFEVVGFPNVDVTHVESIDAVMDRFRPSFVINCSAYNQVDDAEKDSEGAFRVNCDGVRFLVEACLRHGSKFVHYSSDYVFDGRKPTAYVEQDESEPVNVYGRSKLCGENAVRSLMTDFLVFRLSWLYGDGVQNFVHKVMLWSQSHDVLSIADDEVSVPTSAKMVVEMTLLALSKELCGLYHLVNSGSCSRKEWAEFVIAELGLGKEVAGVSRDSFGLAALRPGFSVMDNSLVCSELGVEIADWKKDLREYLQHMTDE